MIARHGEERTQEILTAGGGTHLLVFPNLVIIGVHLRVIRPVTVLTEVFLYPTLLKGAPAEVNATRLRGHESFYGPAGGGQPTTWRCSSAIRWDSAPKSTRGYSLPATCIRNSRMLTAPPWTNYR